MIAPSLAVERSLLRGGHRVIVGMDEVGRGALAGPVCVGAVAIAAGCGPFPTGLRDSKLLSAAQRSALRTAVGAWGSARAVGWASAAEVDAVGIIGALRRAGLRALAGLGCSVDVVLLDGTHDWLTTPPSLLDEDESAADGGVSFEYAGTVVTRPKADRDCAVVAAASVLAKCARDEWMIARAAEHPGYGWETNVGYGTAEHVAALRSQGPSDLHRRSWRLPVAAGDAAVGAGLGQAAPLEGG